jgi:hypothetical protein
MRHFLRLPLIGMTASLALAACSSDSTSPEPAAAPTPSMSVAQTGNGAPSGAHYTLNIIGVSKDKNPNMAGAGGDVIFVDLGSKSGAAVTTKIMLEQSASAGEFAVLDKDGTDGTARFSLPLPGTYTVWARPLGTPGGFASLTTCAEDVAGNGTTTDEVCSTQHEVFVRGSGKVGSFKDVTTNLTTISIDPVLDAAAVTACGSTTVGLFDPCLENYFWKYDNNGLRVLQIRFYAAQ